MGALRPNGKTELPISQKSAENSQYLRLRREIATAR